MKAKRLILVLLIIPNIILGQNYCPFDFENGLWETDDYIPFGQYQYTAHYAEYNEYTIGDTLVNDSLLCYKLFRTGKTCHYNTDDCSTGRILPFSEHLGLICEQDKKVYYNGDVLYDFNVEVGDTISHWWEMYSGTITIAEVDSIEMCGKMRRRLKMVHDWIPTYFIEGIGSTAGLIPRYRDYESASILECYSDQNCEPCLLINDTEEDEEEEEQGEEETPQIDAKVYPNPFSNYIFINVEIVDYAVNLYNSSGQIIKTFENESNLELAELPSGVYVLGIHSQDNIFYEKIVKYK